MPLFLAGCSTEEVIIKERSFVVDFVMWLFDEVLEYILFTPFQFFTHSTSVSILLKMSMFSGALMTLFTSFEGLKRMIGMNYTSMMQIVIRYPIGLAISAAAPFLFYGMGMATNELVELMGLITRSSMEGRDHFAGMLQGLSSRIFEAILTFFFLVVMGYYLFRVLLYHAVRWFGLLFNFVTTPIAMTAFVFRHFENVARGWFQDTIQKFFVVVAHSFMLGLIGVILYAPQLEVTKGWVDHTSYLIIKLMFAIGGLHLMIKPPSWIQQFFDSGSNTLSTLQHFRPITSIINRMNYTFGKKGV